MSESVLPMETVFFGGGGAREPHMGENLCPYAPPPPNDPTLRLQWLTLPWW